MLFLNILNECVISSFFFFFLLMFIAFRVWGSQADVDHWWKLNSYRAIKCSEAFVLCARKMGELYRPPVPLGFDIFCALVSAFFWHQWLNPGSENLWFFFAWLGFTASFSPELSLVLPIPLSSGGNTCLTSGLADALCSPQHRVTQLLLQCPPHVRCCGDAKSHWQ